VAAGGDAAAVAEGGGAALGADRVRLAAAVTAAVAALVGSLGT
jgi:hypothetical protein